MTLYSLKNQRPVNSTERVHALSVRVVALLGFSLACASAVASDVATGPVSFSRDIVPVLTRAGCNSGACHGSFQGRGGFSLSLLGYDPVADYESVVLAGRGRRVSSTAAGQSLLLRKATGSIPHGGGQRIDRDSKSFQLLQSYLEQGAPAPGQDFARVVRLLVEPESLVMSPGDEQSVSVTAEWDDGITRDVTDWALFDSRDARIVEASQRGNVTAVRSGKSPVTVRFLGQVAAVDVTVPFAAETPINDLAPAGFIDDLALAEWRRVGIAGKPAFHSEFLRFESVPRTKARPAGVAGLCRVAVCQMNSVHGRRHRHDVAVFHHLRLFGNHRCVVFRRTRFLDSLFI